MSQILNTTPETLGVGAIVKFNSSCPVITTLIKGDARLGMGSVSGKATFTVVTPGDYEFKATCDCGASYTVMYAGEGAGECCVNPLTNPAGELLGIEIGGDEFFSPATSDPVTYAWAETNPVDGDGIVEWTGTPSDGSADQVITIAEPTVDTDTDTVFTSSTLDPATGVVTQTFEDADGNALPNQSLDLSALISTDHPVLSGAGSTNVAFDAASNTWTVTGAADTDTSVVVVNNADGSQSLQNVDIDGNNVGAPVALTDANNISQHVSLNQPNSPIKIVETAAGVFTHDYDTSTTPDTSNAPTGALRSVVESTSGDEFVLRSGPGWVELHSGTLISVSALILSGEQNTWKHVPLPVTLNADLGFNNAAYSVQDYEYKEFADQAPASLLQQGAARNDFTVGRPDVNKNSSIAVMATSSDSTLTYTPPTRYSIMIFTTARPV